MKRLISALLAMMILIPLLPLTPAVSMAEEAADWEAERAMAETAALREELEMHGSVEMAMHVWAEQNLRFCQGYFDALGDLESSAFRKTLQTVYGELGQRSNTQVIANLVSELGFAMAERDSDWKSKENAVALYIQYLLLLTEMDNMEFEKMANLVARSMPQRDMRREALFYLADLLMFGTNEFIGQSVKKGKELYNNAKLSREMGDILGGVIRTSRFLNALDPLKTFVEESAYLYQNQSALGQVINAHQHVTAGLTLMETLSGAYDMDEDLSEAYRMLNAAYTEYQQKLAELSMDPSTRDKLEDDGYLSNLFAQCLTSKATVYGSDTTGEVIDMAVRTVDAVFGGLGNLTASGLLIMSEQKLGTKSAYTHLHAMSTLDGIYRALESGFTRSNTWESNYAYAEHIRRLCAVMLLGERHVYDMVAEDAGAWQKLVNKIGFDLLGKNKITEARDWYNQRELFIQTIYNMAGDYMDGLLEHYEALRSVEEDVTPLLGHEGESTGRMRGQITQDLWFSKLDGSDNPDKSKVNPEAGEIIEEIPVFLKAGEEIIAMTETDATGKYNLVYNRADAAGKQLRIQIGAKGNGEYAVRTIAAPQYASIRFPLSYELNGMSGMTHTVRVPYSDSYFVTGSGYSQELALASLGLSAAAMSRDGDGNIRSALSGMGFSVVQTGNYDMDLNEVGTKAPFAIGTRVFEEPNSRDEDPVDHRVIVVAVGGDVDVPAMANVLQDDDAINAIATPINQILTSYISSVWDPEVPLHLWFTGFSWGGTVANRVCALLSGQNALRGKPYSRKVYTFASPGNLQAAGYNLVYRQDAIAQGLVAATPGADSFDNVGRGSTAQKVIASWFHRFTGMTSYNPSWYTADEDVIKNLRALPAENGHRNDLLSAIMAWKFMRDEAGTDFRYLSDEAQHDAVLEQLGLAHDQLKFTPRYEMARDVLHYADVPAIWAMPGEAQNALGGYIHDVLELAAMYSGRDDRFSLTEESAKYLMRTFLLLDERLADPSSMDSIAFAHHPEMYLAWLMGTDSWSLAMENEQEAFSTAVLPLPVNVKGVVLDKETKKPLKGVKLTIPGEETTQVLETDEEGRWETFLYPDQHHKLTFTLSGYKQEEVEIPIGKLGEEVLELTTYMERIPLATLIMLTEQYYEKGDHYTFTACWPRVYSALNPNLTAQVDSVLQPYKDKFAETMASMRDPLSYPYQDAHELASVTIYQVYSNGYFFSLDMRSANDYASIGHTTGTDYSFVFEVETGRRMGLKDLYNPENPDAEDQFIAVMDKHLKEHGVTEIRASKIYKELLKPCTTDYRTNTQVPWRMDSKGLTMAFSQFYACRADGSYISSLLLPYEDLKDIFAEQFMPIEPIGVADCISVPGTEASVIEFGEEPDIREIVLNSDAGNSTRALHVDGVLTHLWINSGNETSREYPAFSRYGYFFGLNDATIRLPNEGKGFTVHWEDSEGIHSKFFAGE